jgi:hypothetical protein
MDTDKVDSTENFKVVDRSVDRFLSLQSPLISFTPSREIEKKWVVLDVQFKVVWKEGVNLIYSANKNLPFYTLKINFNVPVLRMWFQGFRMTL